MIIKFPCCFCGGNTDNPVSVTVCDEELDVAQTWWGHLACFKKTLTFDAQLFRPEFE